MNGDEDLGEDVTMKGNKKHTIGAKEMVEWNIAIIIGYDQEGFIQSHSNVLKLLQGHSTSSSICHLALFGHLTFTFPLEEPLPPFPLATPSKRFKI